LARVPSHSLAALKATTPTLSVGVLTANLLELGAEIRVLEQAGVRVVHFDVMDGCFCPAMTVGPPFIKAVKTALLKDAHLMIDEPLTKAADYVAAGADIVTVHIEASRHMHRVLQQLGQMPNANDAARGIVRGVALNPGTPVEAVEAVLDEAEMVLLLAVNPGWGGQKFIPATMDRMARLQEIVERSKRELLIGVDGGITRQNIASVARAGADLIVTGSAVFDGSAAAENARALLQAVQLH
jgi:ribulose-phosphate 3-epimerase